MGALGIRAFKTADARENEDKCHYQPGSESENCAKRNMIHRILRTSYYAAKNHTPGTPQILAGQPLVEIMKRTCAGLTGEVDRGSSRNLF